MAQAAARAGYHVHVATHVNKERRTIEKLGFDVHPVNWRRGSLDPFDNISTLFKIRRLYGLLKPDITSRCSPSSSVPSRPVGCPCSRPTPFRLAAIECVWKKCCMTGRLKL